MPIPRQSWRFFAPRLGVPDPANPPTDTTALFQLERRGGEGEEAFGLLAPVGYLDRRSGDGVVAPHDLPLDLGLAQPEPPRDADAETEVPRTSTFKTDLTSVPDIFTWLVPKTGDHLPAAIIHDSMIGDDEYLLVRARGGSPPVGGFVPHDVVWSPETGTRSPLTAVDADRIFRDAMADSGTGVIRRWLVWTAVTLRTIFTLDETSPSVVRRWYHALIAGVTLVGIAWLGYQATAQIFGWTDTWLLTYELPWITSDLPSWLEWVPWIDDGFGSRFATGLVGAVLIPIPFALAWGRFWGAGLIASFALAVLFHVTIALIVLSGAYVLTERVVTSASNALASDS